MDDKTFLRGYEYLYDNLPPKIKEIGHTGFYDNTLCWSAWQKHIWLFLLYTDFVCITWIINN